VREKLPLTCIFLISEKRFFVQFFEPKEERWAKRRQIGQLVLPVKKEIDKREIRARSKRALNFGCPNPDYR
jgi:hypothetical protein